MITVSELNTVVEKHAVSQPTESIGQDDLAFGARWNAVQFDSGHHFVADRKIDLVLMGLGECVWLPKRHKSILPYGAWSQATILRPDK